MKIIIRKNIGWRLTFVGLYIWSKVKLKTQLTHSKNQPEMNPIHKKSTSTIIDINKKDKQKRS